MLAAVSVSLSVTSGRAADDECLRAPNGTAPTGSHWYYFVDRSTGRHCWYLGAQGKKVRSARGSLLSDQQAAQPSEPAAEPANQPAPPSTPLAGTAGPIATFFSQYWPTLSAPAEIVRQAPASVGNNDAKEPVQEDSEDDMPLVWPVLTAADADMPSVSAVRHEHMLAILVGALALAGIMVGLMYRLAPSRRRQPSLARQAIPANAPRLQMRPPTAAGANSRPTGLVRPPVAAKPTVDPDRELHEARRVRELREIRQGLESRLEELRDARRRSAA